MKNQVFAAWFVLTLPFVGLSQTKLAGGETEYIMGEVLIQLAPGYRIQQVTHSFSSKEDVHEAGLMSEHMRIWLLRFNEQVIGHDAILARLRSMPAVQIVQNNHVIEERVTTSNDPGLNSQWHHVNTGQTGGTNDADIDSDEAWDITTGGLTAHGDTVVIALVEPGGANYQHPDLIGNFWRNYLDPVDGMDNDGNGYTDDFEGWNVSAGNDNHSAGNHGTQCMGMMAAVGNNATGISGANWNVKVMLVSGFSLVESSVIAAYSYPLKMRKMYNDSNGSSGAFVVATSSSWGIDFGNPDNYPLWCAFYDTLGTYGILNPGATTNTSNDIDAVGDMPTACASPYMISVTRTDASDGQAGGYGVVNVDLGAPGINVFTTSSTSSYSTSTGTSFSCPLTAGVIALMYSVPCTGFMNHAKANPQAAADTILKALYQGVDVVPSLVGKSATEGRLNAFNAVNYLVQNCGLSTNDRVNYDARVEVFPNPAHDNVQVYLPDFNGLPTNEVEWSLINSLGQEVQQQILYADRTTLSVAHLAAGAYQYRIRAGANVLFSGRFIIER